VALLTTRSAQGNHNPTPASFLRSKGKKQQLWKDALCC